ncbi:alkaline-phosphatase-like protein [Gongronella butleri]|nr:alkaline-phosphatase-like protein [Gongronella butleri]
MKLTLLGAAAYFLLGVCQAQADDRPNILFIFTDDQDSRLNSIDYMPNVQKHLVQQGTTYRNHYVTTAVCCPSRVSLLRCQYAHNTNITHVMPPFGGYERFNKIGLGEENLPVWMQRAGYYTHFIGKLMNGYEITNYNNPIPRGFDYQEQLVDPFTYIYDRPVFSINGEKPVFYKDQYQTDVIHAKAVRALKNQENTDKPFFLWVAPMAPHSNFAFEEGPGIVTTPPISAARHAHLFKDVKVPRTPNFNPAVPTKTASFWKQLQQADEATVEQFDEVHRARLRALQAVDEMVGSLIDELDKQGKLDNTYIIYSSDNGYHIGQHRAYPGKTGNSEEDINVPFIVRGPGIAKGAVSDVISAHHDIGPTLLALAQASDRLPSWVDGGVIPLTEELRSHPKPAAKESFGVEFWMEAPFADIVGPQLSGVNSYKTLRVISEHHNYKYTVWCTGEHEFFDLTSDPYELHNDYENLDPQLASRLDALLLVLKSCRAGTCRDPWSALHPNEFNVQSLSDALDAKFDGHYEQFRSVSFNECLLYQDESNEQPIFGEHFKDNVTTKANIAHEYTPSAQMGTLTQNSWWQKVFQPLTQARQQLYKHDAVTKTRSPFNNKEIKAMLNLVPEPAALPGQTRLGDDVETFAQPVPQELLDQKVDWVHYGFYTRFGN